MPGHDEVVAVRADRLQLAVEGLRRPHLAVDARQQPLQLSSVRIGVQRPGLPPCRTCRHNPVASHLMNERIHARTVGGDPLDIASEGLAVDNLSK